MNRRIKEVGGDLALMFGASAGLFILKEIPPRSIEIYKMSSNVADSVEQSVTHIVSSGAWVTRDYLTGLQGRLTDLTNIPLSRENEERLNGMLKEVKLLLTFNASDNTIYQQNATETLVDIKYHMGKFRYEAKENNINVIGSSILIGGSLLAFCGYKLIKSLYKDWKKIIVDYREKTGRRLHLVK